MSICCAGTPAPATPLSREDRDRLILGVEPLIRRLVRDTEVPVCDRRDVAQDAFVELLKGVDRYDADKASWNSFVGGVVRRAVAAYFRSKYGNLVESVHPAPDRLPSNDALPGDGPTDILSELVAAEDEAASRAADLPTWEAFSDLLRTALQTPLLDGLRPYTRRVVELLLGGLTPSQAAEQLGIAVKDAKLAVRNGVAAVEKVLPPDERARVGPQLEAIRAAVRDGNDRLRGEQRRRVANQSRRKRRFTPEELEAKRAERRAATAA